MDLNTLAVSANVLPDSCSGYILLTATEYNSLNSPFSNFDSTLFMQILGAELLFFFLMFGAGVMVRRMRL